MSNFELIDDYLTSRLSDGDKVAFEQRLASDPSLKADVELQKNILEGIKKARALELKSMLNNVPLTGLNGGFTAGKIAATIATVGLVSTALYFYLTSADSNETVVTQEEVVTGNPQQPEDLSSPPDEKSPAAEVKKEEDKEENAAKEERKPAAAKANVKKAVKEPVAKENKPKIEVTDPTEELPMDNETREAKTEGVKPAISTSHIAVETDSSSKKYNFHYQFSSGKLMLYGSFDKSLYEILEISGETQTVFLFYKENYYFLDEKQNKITALQPIKDAALIKKLKEYQHQ